MERETGFFPLTDKRERIVSPPAYKEGLRREGVRKGEGEKERGGRKEKEEEKD